MCNYCEELLKCPVGEKRKSVIEEYHEHYVGGECSGKTEMVIDRYPTHNHIFVHSEYTDEDGFWHNMAYDIAYCPMCGTALDGKEQGDER